MTMLRSSFNVDDKRTCASEDHVCRISEVWPNGTLWRNLASEPSAVRRPVPGSKLTEIKISRSAHFGKSIVVVLGARVASPLSNAVARCGRCERSAFKALCCSNDWSAGNKEETAGTFP